MRRARVVLRITPALLAAFCLLAIVPQAQAWGEVLVRAATWQGVDVHSNFPRPVPFNRYGGSGYGVKWIDEIRVYQGGYTGVRNAVVKSLTGTEDADPTPAPTTGAPSIPLAAFLPVIALAGAAILPRRR